MRVGKRGGESGWGGGDAGVVRVANPSPNQLSFSSQL